MAFQKTKGNEVDLDNFIPFFKLLLLLILLISYLCYDQAIFRHIIICYSYFAMFVFKLMYLAWECTGKEEIDEHVLIMAYVIYNLFLLSSHFIPIL